MRQQYRCNIQKKLEELIHPLRPNQHSNELLNIALGKIQRDIQVLIWLMKLKLEKNKRNNFMQHF